MHIPFYEGEGELDITYGFSKDHRPHLKQFVYGLVTNAESVPLFGEVCGGNLSDKQWNHELIGKLSKHLSPETLKKLVYVADSSLVTAQNLEKNAEEKIKFISRLQRNFNIAEALEERTWQEDNWTSLGQLTGKKKSAYYRIQEFTAELEGRQYRFIVVHSSHLDKRKAKTLQRNLEKERANLMDSVKEFEKLTFACEADAQAVLERFLKEHRSELYPLTGDVNLITRPKKRRRGRPRKDEQPELETIYQVSIKVGDLDEEAVKRARERLPACLQSLGAKG